MTEQELADLCREWQWRLGLAHWRMIVKSKRMHDMPMQDIEGYNCFNIATETAIIFILDPIDYVSDFPQDQEMTLVHELLHILMHYIVVPAEESPENPNLEATISRIARALVDLKRQPKETPNA